MQSREQLATSTIESLPSSSMQIVTREDFPDPSVFEHNGMYFAHATHDRNNHVDAQRIKAAYSYDMVNWTVLTEDALVVAPDWSNGDDYWAPHVVYDDNSQKFRMYYAARLKEGKGFGISVAESAHPLTGFVDTSSSPILAGVDNEYIDPFVYKKNGKWFVVWGSDGKPICEQELTDDGKHIAQGSSKRVLLDVVVGHVDERLVEGAYIDTYTDPQTGEAYTYLYYSGADTFGNGTTRRGVEKFGNYAVMVARLNPMTGTFERRTDVDPTCGSNII